MAVFFALGGVTVWFSLEPMWMIIVANMMARFGRWAAWINLMPVILAPLAVWGMLRLMDYLRRRWLWRESGMVKPLRWVVSPQVNMLSAVILLGGVALSLGLRQWRWSDDAFVLRMLWAATGWGFGYTLMGVGQHVGISRYVWLGAVGGSVSTLVLFLPLTFGQTALVFGLSWSLMLMVSGTIALRRGLMSAQGNR